MSNDLAIDSTGRFHVKTWEDEAVAYDGDSGDTHLFESVAVEILQYLAEGARSQDDVYRHLSTTFDLATDESGLRLIAVSLEQLRQIGIVVTRGK